MVSSPFLWSFSIAAAIGAHDVNFPCERIAQGDAAVIEENLLLRLTSYPALSFRFDSLLETLPNQNLPPQIPHAPTWAAWGLAVRHENEHGAFVEVGHWSGHGIPGPSFFRESQWSEVKIGIRFGEKMPLVPVQVR